MVTIVSGLIGGFVATLVMTIFMMLVGDDSPPPTALFYSKYVGGESPDQYMMQGMLLHFVYGIVAGGVFVAVVPALGFVSTATLGAAILWGLVYGLVLFVIAAAFWMMMILGMSPEMKMAGTFLFFHLVYGVVLGAWVGTGILD